MDLLTRVLECKTDEEADQIIKEEIEQKQNSTKPIEQLGFLNYGKTIGSYKGFIPLNTRMKYASLNIETYGMETTDFFYEFTHFIRKYNIKNKSSLIHNLEYFINEYFGYRVTTSREDIFNDISWNSTSTDEEYFERIKNNKLGDLKGKNAAECTERGALAQQILSLYGTETYYCMGCVDLGYKQEGHCFNIVKTKNGYAILDYSIPVGVYNQNNKLAAYFPFVGELTNEEFEEFITTGVIKKFENYKYVGKEKQSIDSSRRYVVGSFTMEKEKTL